MKNRVQKWGNSLAVRVPRSFAKTMGWEEDSPVAISLEEDALIIKTDRERAWDLGSLLGRITNENVHPAWEAGSAAPSADDVDGESALGGGKSR